MGKVRRAIVRSDEAEVRARVEPFGYPVRVDQWGTIHIDGFVTKKLAGVGIHGGPDGWEIEVRRELPAPWRWDCDGDGSDPLHFLSRTGKKKDAIATARSKYADIYPAEDKMIRDLRIPAASPAEARERAEDECWSRGLFGAVEDAPGVPLVDLLLCVLGSCSWPDPKPAMPEVRAALASIGAVAEGNRWRLSDGPPPGWEWYRLETVPGREVLSRGPGLGLIAAVNDGSRITWEDGPRPGCLAYAVASVAEGKSAAILYARRAGLFATVEQAAEGPASPTDAGIERDPAVTTDVPQGAGMGAQVRTIEGLVFDLPIWEKIARLLGVDPELVVVGHVGVAPYTPIAWVTVGEEMIGEEQWSKLHAAGLQISRRSPPDGVLSLPSYAPSPDPAAHALRALVARITGLDHEGTIVPTPGETAAQRGAQIGRLSDAFVAEMRAPMPSPQRSAPCADCAALNAECLRLAERADTAEKLGASLTDEVRAVRELLTRANEKAARTTDGALTAYLMEHHRDEWRPGDDALALTIRLLDAARAHERLADGTAAVHASKMREVEEDRDAFAAEARAAGALAATREQERDALANTAATMRRERDEALNDLHTVRADALAAARDLAIKMGAPHG